MKPEKKASNIAQNFVPYNNIESRATYEEVKEACIQMHKWDVEQFEKYIVNLLNQKHIQDCDAQRILLCDILAEIVVKWKKKEKL